MSYVHSDHSQRGVSSRGRGGGKSDVLVRRGGGGAEGGGERGRGAEAGTHLHCSAVLHRPIICHLPLEGVGSRDDGSQGELSVRRSE